jgi:phenylalanyl-tRNA synthetase beta chain
MKVSLNWLREFVEVPTEPRQLKAGLTSIGLNVESFTAVGDDVVLDVEVTTNRPDCLSHYGVAREVATLYRKPLKKPKFPLQESAAAAAGEITIEIADPDLCARYCGRIVRNIQVRPSPDGLARRLAAVGQRPINNVADVTNYVLMELGHPLHAFDLARVRDHKIIVRRAKAGERLKTLDGVERKLSGQDLVIADAARPVAIAGVMGGEDSEIAAGTRAVLIESAWFDPPSIRRTAKSQGLHTEASHRFERGADIEMAPRAADRAAALIAELAGGEILKGRVDVYPVPRQLPEVSLRAKKIFSLLGAGIPGEEVERILRSLEFEIAPGGDESWRVKAPSFRLDVAREVDLIEEVARHYGYDRLPSRVRPAPPRIERDAVREQTLAATAILTGLGYREIIPPNMVDPEESKRFADFDPVQLANPLSQEASAMRATTIPAMVRALRWNLDRNQPDLRFFELGKIYIARISELPEERSVLTLGSCGRASRQQAGVETGERMQSFLDLKGDMEELLASVEIPELRFEAGGPRAFENGQSGRFLAGAKTIATFGQLSSAIAAEYKLRQPVWLAEIDFDLLLGFPPRRREFRAFSKFPAVQRDFSLIVPEGLSYGSLAGAIRELREEAVAGFEPIEWRQASDGELPAGAVPKGHVSLLLRVTFQSETRTLTGEEIEEARGKILKSLETLKVRLRS